MNPTNSPIMTTFDQKNAYQVELNDRFYQMYEQNRAPDQVHYDNEEIFKVLRINSAYYNTADFGGAGFVETVSEDGVPSQDKGVFGKTRSERVVVFSKSVPISNLALRTNQHSEWQKTMESVARAVFMSRDREAFGLFNRGVVGYTGSNPTLTNQSELWFGTHNLLKGGTTTNALPAGTLVDDNGLSQLFSVAANLVDHAGMPFMDSPSILLTPSTNAYWNAIKVTKAMLVAGTNFNDPNPLNVSYGGLRVMQNVFLSARFGGSDTACYGISRLCSATRLVEQELTTKLFEPTSENPLVWNYNVQYTEKYFVESYEGAYYIPGV